MQPAINLKDTEAQRINFHNGDELGTFIIVVEEMTEDGYHLQATVRYSVGMEQAP